MCACCVASSQRSRRPACSTFQGCFHVQVFIADDPSRDPPRRTYVTPEALLCSACQLPECKPGCPAGLAARGLASPPTGPAEPIPTAAAAAVDDSAFSEGRSSEDSVLLGLPSPTYSVLPPPAGLQRLAAGAASFGCSDASPSAEPALKQQRVGGWDAVAEPPSPAAASGSYALPAAAAPAADAVASSEAVLAAALRSISKGFGDDDDAGSPSPRMPAPAPSASLPQLPAVTRKPAPWERPAPPAAMVQAGSGGGSSSAALSAALANISKGLLEDGLL